MLAGSVTVHTYFIESCKHQKLQGHQKPRVLFGMLMLVKLLA